MPDAAGPPGAHPGMQTPPACCRHPPPGTHSVYTVTSSARCQWRAQALCCCQQVQPHILGFAFASESGTLRQSHAGIRPSFQDRSVLLHNQQANATLRNLEHRSAMLSTAQHIEAQHSAETGAHLSPSGAPEQQLVAVAQVPLDKRRCRRPERMRLEPPCRRPAASRHRGRHQRRQRLGKDRPHHGAPILRTHPQTSEGVRHFHDERFCGIFYQIKQDNRVLCRPAPNTSLKEALLHCMSDCKKPDFVNNFVMTRRETACNMLMVSFSGKGHLVPSSIQSMPHQAAIWLALIWLGWHYLRFPQHFMLRISNSSQVKITKRNTGGLWVRWLVFAHSRDPPDSSHEAVGGRLRGCIIGGIARRDAAHRLQHMCAVAHRCCQLLYEGQAGS